MPLAQGRARLRFPTREKPLGPLRIDWRHPLTQALSFCMVHGDLAPGADFDLVQGGELVVPSAPVDTSLGAGTDFNITGTTTYDAGYNGLATSTGDGLGDFTLACFGQLNAASGDASVDCSIVLQQDPTFTTGIEIYAGPSAQRWQGWTSGSGNVSTGPAYHLGIPVALMLTRAAGRVTFYVDGVSTGSTAGDTTNATPSGSTLRWGYDGFGTSDTHDFVAFQTACWDRPLDASEATVWSQEPYAFLAPLGAELPVLVSAARPVPPLSYRRPNQHLYRR